MYTLTIEAATTIAVGAAMATNVLDAVRTTMTLEINIAGHNVSSAALFALRGTPPP